MSSESNSTWTAAAGNGEWTTVENWNPEGVPTDTATFDGSSSQKEVGFPQGSSSTVNSIHFAANAPGQTFLFKYPVAENTPALTIAGDGVTNDSAHTQHFVVASSAIGYDYAQLQFINSASAGGPNVLYFAGPETPESPAGGVIRFINNSTAGSAAFVVTTGAGTPPRENSTVGAEVSFGDNATAATATFTIYGSTSLTDGDTFGNVVFHNDATADAATFTNKGGTVPGGDGGNTQFYDQSTAANGVFYNQGGTAYGQLSEVKGGEVVLKFSDKDGKQVAAEQGANGGDVAFDGSATGAHGHFHNYAATVEGANGGVTSFNNNPPNITPFTAPGANSGHGFYTNYGANGSNLGGGGHTYFTSKHGSASAAFGTFNNNGSSVSKSSSAGHTVFSITEGTDGTSTSYGDAKPSGKPGSVYFPTAANGTFWNHPATTKDGAPGYTEFTVYQPYGSDGSSANLDPGPDSPNFNNVPTAGNGTFYNLCGKVEGAAGGVTKFYATSRAGSATLIAYGGDAGEPGQIQFGDKTLGESASVQLHQGGILSLSYHTGGLSIGQLTVYEAGTIKQQLGEHTTDLSVHESLRISGDAVLTFDFYAKGEIEPGQPFTVLTASNLSDYSEDSFKGNRVCDLEPTFRIDGDKLVVVFEG